MTKRIVSFLLTITVLLTLFTGCGKGKERFDVRKTQPKGFIHAEGMHLALDGKTIVLKGVNAGGWLLTEDWFTPTSLDGDLNSEHGQYELEKAFEKSFGAQKTKALFETYREHWWREEDFRTISDIGFNLIRLPFGWKDVTDAQGHVNRKALARLDWFVEMCEKYRLFVIPDLHGAYGSQNGRHHSGTTTTGGDLYGNAENERLTIQLWKTLAEHFKDNHYIAGYDLLNEPEGKPDGLTEKTQWDFYDRLYKEIRTVDTNHILFLESCWDADHMPNPKDYGWENVAYEYHYYNWDNGNDIGSMKSFFRYKGWMEFKLNTLQYKVPVFIGEFTFFDNPDCWRYGLDFFEKHEMSWAMWTYKGQVQSNWVLYRGTERTAENIVTPQTDYQKAEHIFAGVQTDTSFHENTALIGIVKEYL